MARIGRSGVITGTTPDIMMVLAVTIPLVVMVVGAGCYYPTCDGCGGGYYPSILRLVLHRYHFLLILPIPILHLWPIPIPIPIPEIHGQSQ